MSFFQALNNGLLIDPHDQKAIADALLKLVADKNLWLECRKSGLKNIHRFSWPEHCRNYLFYVEHCRSRHPTNRLVISIALVTSRISNAFPFFSPNLRALSISAN